MGWSWDHDKTRATRSYNAHAELGQHLKSIAPGWAWTTISALFTRASGDQFDIQPQQAARMAEALTALAPLAVPDWQHAIRDLAASAREAARMGAVWHWS